MPRTADRGPLTEILVGSAGLQACLPPRILRNHALPSYTNSNPHAVSDHAADAHDRAVVRRATIIDPTRLTASNSALRHTMRWNIRLGPE